MNSNRYEKKLSVKYPWAYLLNLYHFCSMNVQRKNCIAQSSFEKCNKYKQKQMKQLLKCMDSMEA